MAQAQFINLNAANDAMVNGGIEIPEFQHEIVDLVRRAGVLGQRVQYVPATGAISRFFEQTAIGTGAFSGTGSQASTSYGYGQAAGANGMATINPSATSPTRVEKSLLIKAITNQINYSLFDMETIAQQNVFAQLKAKDLKDMVNGIILSKDAALWTGTDTVSGSQVGAGTSLQFAGLFNQISNTLTIANGVSIIDNIRTQVAKLMNNTTYMVKPTAIFMNPLAIDYLEQESKSQNNAMKYIATDVMEAKVGLTVSAISTVAGLLPIIPDVHMTMNASVGATPIGAAPAGQANYPFAILTEDLVEFHYVGSKDPRVFQLGTVADLAEKYVGVQFGAPVVKGASYAHTVGVIQR